MSRFLDLCNPLMQKLSNHLRIAQFGFEEDDFFKDISARIFDPCSEILCSSQRCSASFLVPQYASDTSLCDKVKVQGSVSCPIVSPISPSNESDISSRATPVSAKSYRDCGPTGPALSIKKHAAVHPRSDYRKQTAELISQLDKIIDIPRAVSSRITKHRRQHTRNTVLRQAVELIQMMQIDAQVQHCEIIPPITQHHVPS